MEKQLIILKRNIVSLMKDHKPEVTQEELGKITGLSQPNISKRLSEKDKSCFSIIQLIAIADYFEVSLDSLIGRNLDSIKQRYETMQDIISALFELDRIKFNVSEKKYEDKEYDEHGRTFVSEISTYYISFPQGYLNDFIGEWNHAMSIKQKNESKVYKDMYESWKRERLNEAAEISLDGSPYYDYLDFDIPDESEL